MKGNRRLRRVKVSADGAGLESRAGTLLLRELTCDTGLADGWTAALLDTYKAFPTVHLPGRVLADLVVMIADGGDALTHLAALNASCSGRSRRRRRRGGRLNASMRCTWPRCGRCVRRPAGGRGRPVRALSWAPG